jgi:exodeoxyribonuclease VII large subunit
MAEPAVELSVSQFVDLLNQTLEFAFNGVVVVGELANLRVSKNRWVYFDLKDEGATVKFFGMVYQLPGPLEDGMVLRVRGLPKLHNLYGFSVNVVNIQLAGEGTIKRGAELLKAKLLAEGLFDDSRKRRLPYPPSRIGLVASKQSAAYADFIKIINARWQGLVIEHIDVQVQGEVAPAQIAAALEQFNAQAEPPEVIVLIRGGGSPEDLAAFSTEQVTRAVAGSRAPTLVAIGHEIDLSLAELAADQRASTPSNAAELLIPDRTSVLLSLSSQFQQLALSGQRQIQSATAELANQFSSIDEILKAKFIGVNRELENNAQLLNALNPDAVLRRGYAIVRSGGRAIRSTSDLTTGGIVSVQLADGRFSAEVSNLGEKNG